MENSVRQKNQTQNCSMMAVLPVEYRGKRSENKNSDIHRPVFIDLLIRINITKR